MTTQPMPNWPRCMKAERAAQYCDVSPSTFLSGVKDGTYPCGYKIKGNRLWYREDLDVALTALKGGYAEALDPFMDALDG